jgi:2-hydroxy-3-keto-5-methylthiopentenyl-1-phosphate phosphatase
MRTQGQSAYNVRRTIRVLVMCEPRTLILDFDGTITVRDADVIIAEAVLDDDGLGFIHGLWTDYERLRITTGQYFERYLDRLQLTPGEFATQAVRVALRPGLGELAAWCEAENIDLHVASEGLDVYIKPILEAAGAGSLPLSCNRARWDGARYQVDSAPDGESCTRCLTCKGALARRLKAAGRSIIMVGNGASDLCGARHADLVIARDSLASHCERESIAYVQWTTLADVRAAAESFALHSR